jgi:hypothetical protein
VRLQNKYLVLIKLKNMFMCLRTVLRSHKPISTFHGITQLPARNPSSVVRQFSQFRYNDIANNRFKDTEFLKQFKITLSNCNKNRAIYLQISIRQKSFDFSKKGLCIQIHKTIINILIFLFYPYFAKFRRVFRFMFIVTEHNPVKNANSWTKWKRKSIQYQTTAERNKSTLLYLLSLAILTAGASYAAVPLYRMFCQATSYGGTTKVGHDTQKVEKMEPQKERLITVKFTADTAATMQWNFKPQQYSINLFAGETALAFYTVRNLK